MFSGFAIAGFFCPLTAAKVKITSGGYTQAFIIAAVLSIAGIVLVQIVRTKSNEAQEARIAASKA